MALDLSFNIPRFYLKDIVKSYSFNVEILDDDLDGAGIPFFQLPKAYDVVDVEIPMYKFEGVVTRYGVGQKSFSVLSNPQEMSVRITFEEDIFGSIMKFIHLLQKKIISSDGFYRPINTQYLKNIIVSVLGARHDIIGKWTFDNCYFLGADNVSLAYDSNDSVKYALNFGVDRIGYIEGGLSPQDFI